MTNQNLENQIPNNVPGSMFSVFCFDLEALQMKLLHSEELLLDLEVHRLNSVKVFV